MKKSKIIPFLTLIFLSFFSSCSLGYDYDVFASIRGTVRDVQSGKGLKDVRVTLMPTSQSVNTEVDGTYVFKNLDAGVYIVIFTMEGYESDRLYVKAISQEETRGDISLKKKSYSNQ